MEIYDTVNKLASEIKNSKQYLDLKQAKENLFVDPLKAKMVEDFEKAKQEIQLLEIRMQNNENIDEEEKKKKLSDMYQVLIENKDIKEYFDLQIIFNEMIVDINKIIGTAIKDVL